MSDRALLIAFLVCVALIVACLIVLGLIAVSARRQRAAVPRVRPERAEEMDLAAERWAFESRRDAYLEDRELRRVA